VRERARELIEELIRSELDAALARPRYERGKKAGREGTPGITGHRHGSRLRSLTVSFGPIEIAVPRARLNTADGKTTEWKSQSLRAYQRRTAGRQRADRQLLPGRHQHAPCAPRAQRSVRWRARQALETTLRQIHAVDPRLSQFGRQHAAASYDEGGGLDHRLDVIGRDARERDKDQDLRLRLQHIDGRLPTRLAPPITAVAGRLSQTGLLGLGADEGGRQKVESDIRDNPSMSRFEMPLGDGALAVAYYKVENGQVVLLHTEVPQELSGLG
jgi:hypothetical protein